MEKQEIFDTVVNHLFTQIWPSSDRNHGGCYYRRMTDHAGMLKCAAGVLISDEDYRPAMDNQNVNTSFMTIVSKNKHLPQWMHLHADLIERLQQFHDRRNFGKFEFDNRDLFGTFACDLQKIATEFDLEFNESELYAKFRKDL